MRILIEKEYLYAGSRGTDLTDYCRQHLKQRGRCLHPPLGWFHGHPIETALGYEKNQKGDMKAANKRNSHSTKKLKSQYGEAQIDISRDRNGKFKPEIVPMYQWDVSGIVEKVIRLDDRG